MEKDKNDFNKGGEKTPGWLKTIQLNSWEAELLISALVLYALFQVPDYLDRFALENFDRGSSMHGLFRFVERAIRLLSLGYILHILIRGIWVASVGLSYVYPKGVNTENLKFKGNFKKELSKTGSLVKMVLRLEELSSIIYGISFIFFGTMLGLASLLFSFVYFFEFMGPMMNANSYLASAIGFLTMFYALLCALVFIDFITNGLFRRKDWSADWFYYVALFFRVMTLSFLYRRSLLVLISNTRGWKSYLVPITVLGVISGFILLSNNFRDNKKDNYYQSNANGDYNSANYENTRNEKDHLVATIQSDIISGNTIKLFLRDIGSFGGMYALEGKLNKTKWDVLSSDSINAYFDRRLAVSIDTNRIEGIKWFKTQHPKNYEFGFTTFIDISELEKGPHFLKLGIDTTKMNSIAKRVVEKDNYSLQTVSNIYFVYEKP